MSVMSADVALPAFPWSDLLSSCWPSAWQQGVSDAKGFAWGCLGSRVDNRVYTRDQDLGFRGSGFRVSCLGL